MQSPTALQRQKHQKHFSTVQHQSQQNEQFTTKKKEKQSKTKNSKKTPTTPLFYASLRNKTETTWAHHWKRCCETHTHTNKGTLISQDRGPKPAHCENICDTLRHSWKQGLVPGGRIPVYHLTARAESQTRKLIQSKAVYHWQMEINLLVLAWSISL